MALAQWISDSGKCAVVLLSGGRDSLLAASLAIEDDYQVIPLICDNGHIQGLDRASFAVKALQDVYGTGKVYSLHTCRMGFTMLSYYQDVLNRSISTLSTEYPGISISQVNCLVCKSAMYVGAVRYCQENGVATIVDGVRRCQGFFVDLESMQTNFRVLCQKAGIQLYTPVWTLESDMTRKRMLDERGLPTHTLEPQCYLGCPLDGQIDELQIRSLGEFYAKELYPLVNEDIKRRE